MTVGGAFAQLGELLSALEANDIEVTAVATDEVRAGESLGVELRLEIPTDGGDSGLSFERALGAPDGGPASTTAGEGTGTTDADKEATADAATSETADAAADSGGGSGTTASKASAAAGTPDVAADPDSHACDRPDCGAHFESAAALTVHRLVAHDRPDEPLHRHEPALEAAYRAYDSFPEMTDALGVDVTPQTVRRNMIDGGIHDPDSPGSGLGSPGEQPAGDGTESDEAREPDEGTEPDEAREPDDGTGAPGEEQSSPEGDRAVTDGSGATADPGGQATRGPDGEPTAGTGPAAGTDEPDDDGGAGDGTDSPSETVADGVTTEALREAIVEGGSLRAAAERLDRDRAETRELLSDLGLLELVHGRVANRPERAERRETFAAWLADRRGQPAED